MYDHPLLFNLTTEMPGRYLYRYFTDKETETQRGYNLAFIQLIFLEQPPTGCQVLCQTPGLV